MKKLLQVSFLLCSSVFVIAQVQNVPKSGSATQDTTHIKTDRLKTAAPKNNTSVSGMPVAKPEDSIRYAALKGPKRDDSLYHMPNREIPSSRYEASKTVIPKKIQGAK